MPNAQQAVWQYGGATEKRSAYCSLISFCSIVTNNIQQLNKQSTFSYKFGFGYGLTNHGMPPHRQAVPLYTSQRWGNTLMLSNDVGRQFSFHKFFG